jgi:hypothetical protein
VTWAAWADIDSLKFGGTENQNAAGRNSGRVFLFGHRDAETQRLKIKFSLRLCVSVAILDLTNPINYRIIELPKILDGGALVSTM